jgi:Phosphotransferase enzyme family
MASIPRVASTPASFLADQPFVIEPPGDLREVTRLAHAATAQWGLPPPRLMRVGMNALFAAGDDVVVRVGRPTSDPRGAVRLAATLTSHGVRTPRYLRDDPVVSGALAAMAIAREAEGGTIDWSEVGSMVAIVHSLDPGEITGFYPVPHCSVFPWWQFERLLAEVDDLLDPDARAGIRRALSDHRRWGEIADAPDVLCHGDVHPGNVLAGAGGPMIIDWDLLCRGPRGWDHGPLMTWTERWGGAPGVYEAFADGYGTSLRLDPASVAIAELRLVAATLMRLRAGRLDAGAAAEAERRLQWWRGDPDAPPWRAA